MAHHPVFKLAPGHLEIDKCLVHLFARSLSKQVLTYQEEACCQSSGIRLDPIALGKARIFGGNSIHQGVEIANGPIDRRDDRGIERAHFLAGGTRNDLAQGSEIAFPGR